jgi:hypothetical protein
MLPSREQVSFNVGPSLRYATSVFVSSAANQMHRQECDLALLGNLHPSVPGRLCSVDAVSDLN